MRLWEKLFPELFIQRHEWLALLDKNAKMVSNIDGSITVHHNTPGPTGGSGSFTIGANDLLHGGLPFLTLSEAINSALVFITRPTSPNTQSGPTGQAGAAGIVAGMVNGGGIDWSEAMYLGRWMVVRSSFEPTKCQLCDRRHCHVYVIRLAGRVELGPEKRTVSITWGRLIARWFGDRKRFCPEQGAVAGHAARASRVMRVMAHSLRKFEAVKKQFGEDAVRPGRLLHNIIHRLRSLRDVGLLPEAISSRD